MSGKENLSMNQERHFIVDILFVLALFGVFAVSALILTTVGAEVYRHTVDGMSDNYEVRTSAAYLTEKIHQYDSLLSDSGEEIDHNIEISTLAGEPALALTQVTGGEEYLTYLYLHDGYLRELTVKSGNYLGEDTLSAGQEIMQLSGFHMKLLPNNLLSLEFITPDGESYEIYVAIRSTP